jgi:hypothetical protein
MQFEVSPAEINAAHAPHNLFVSGLFLIDLMMSPAVIVLKLGMPGLMFTLFCSLALLGYIYLRSRKTTTWFVDAHWRLSWSRCRILMFGYTLSAVLIGLAWLVSLSAHEASMGHIMWTAMTRIALVPTLLIVLLTAIMEAGAIGMASKGEVPDKIVAAFPPPPEMKRLEQEIKELSTQLPPP